MYDRCEDECPIRVEFSKLRDKCLGCEEVAKHKHYARFCQDENKKLLAEVIELRKLVQGKQVIGG